MADEFKVTFFEHKDARSKIEAVHTLESLAELIRSTQAEAKDLLPWLKLSGFGDLKSPKGSLRHDANVRFITGVEADYDGERMSFDDAVMRLADAGVRALVYTSPSHEPDKPRWRVLCPLSAPYVPEVREKFLSRLNGLFEGIFADESFTLSQSYYLGHLVECTEYRVELVDGKYLDHCVNLDQVARGKSTHAKQDGLGSNGAAHERTNTNELAHRIMSGENLHTSVGPIAGSYAGRGIPFTACVDFIGLAFDSAHQPRYGGRWDEVLEFIAWVYAKEARKQPPATPIAPLPFANLALDGLEVPEPEWAVLNRIPLRQVCLFSGHGAVGKSTAALKLSVAHVLGRDWFGSMPTLGAALFFDCEDDFSAIHFRLDAVRRFYAVTYQDMVNGGLDILAMAGLECVLATVNPKSGTVSPTPIYQQLLQRCGDIKYVQVIIANSANVFAGNENDRSQVQQFIGLLKRITNASGGSVVLLSHSSLSGLATETGLSGTTQWHNAVRARMWMHGVKSEDADGQPSNDIRVIEFLKNQYGRVDDSVTLRWKDGLYQIESKNSGYLSAAREDEINSLFLTLLRRFAREGRRVSPNPSVTYAPTRFAEQEEAKTAKASMKELRVAMERLLKNGKIVVKNWGPISKPRPYLDMV